MEKEKGVEKITSTLSLPCETSLYLGWKDDYPKKNDVSYGTDEKSIK